ncbi:MAG: septum formation initiator family protein [Clostridium sp.]|nr:septum formation initiator family protein [Clostridium sp.]
MNRIKKETKEKTKKLQQVKEENEKLTEEINMSQTDEYHEKLAREKLNMIKDGEKTVEKESTRAPLVEESSEGVLEESQEETSNKEDNSNSNND